MNLKEIKFTLPIGYEDENGTFHRDGIMKMATAYTEIEASNHEKTYFNKRYRDSVILSLVIKKLGDVTTIDSDIIENLYEVDFLYLQILYNKLNKDQNELIETRCPECGVINGVYLPDMYKELHDYFSGKKDE